MHVQVHVQVHVQAPLSHGGLGVTLKSSKGLGATPQSSDTKEPQDDIGA